MLKPEEITEAINYLYKDFPTWQVGNPLPFVKTYDTGGDPLTNINLFNELMHGGGTLKNIFYGRITYSMWNQGIASAPNIQLYYYVVPDMSVSAFALNVVNDLPATPSFFEGTTQGLFVQDASLDNGNCSITFDGYIFGLEEK